MTSELGRLGVNSPVATFAWSVSSSGSRRENAPLRAAVIEATRLQLLVGRAFHGRLI